MEIFKNFRWIRAIIVIELFMSMPHKESSIFLMNFFKGNFVSKINY